MEKRLPVAGGYLHLKVEEDLQVVFTVKSSGVTVQLTLSQAAAATLADALDDMSSYHPQMCASCGQVGGTKGCACDPAPVQWATMKRKNYGDGEDEDLLLCYHASQAAAERHAGEMAAAERTRGVFSHQFFAAEVRE